MKRLNAYFQPTRFAGFGRWQSRLILSVFVIVIFWAVIFCVRPAPLGSSGTGSGDAAVYLRIIDHLHAGGDYYSVVASELRANNYASRSVFNWRLPLLAWFLAKMPQPQMGKWILVFLSLATLVMWLPVLAQAGGFWMALLGGLGLLGMVVCCFAGDGFVFHELWAGVLIAFSIAVYSRSRPLSVVSALLALFIRELSLAFAVVMLITAYIEKRRYEVLAWLLGIAALFVYFFVHAKIVSGLLTAADRTGRTWIQFGGLSFVLSTTRWTLFTVTTPFWVNAILFPLAFLGAVAWRGTVGRRVALTLCVYVFAFSIAGRQDNYYWGLMYAPLLPIGLVFAPPALADLWKTAIFSPRNLPF